jgi:hypothetical protein
MGEEFWAMAERGFLSALGEGANEPFGVWPQPPIPQPKAHRAILPITHSTERN